MNVIPNCVIEDTNLIHHYVSSENTASIFSNNYESNYTLENNSKYLLKQTLHIGFKTITNEYVFKTYSVGRYQVRTLQLLCSTIHIPLTVLINTEFCKQQKQQKRYLFYINVIGHKLHQRISSLLTRSVLCPKISPTKFSLYTYFRMIASSLCKFFYEGTDVIDSRNFENILHDMAIGYEYLQRN